MAFAFMAFMAFFMGFAAGAGAAAAAFAFIAFIALAMASRGDGYQHEERNPRLEPKWQSTQLVSTACNSKPSKSVSTQLKSNGPPCCLVEIYKVCCQDRVKLSESSGIYIQMLTITGI